MSYIFSLSLMTALLCGLWGLVAGFANLLVWGGFAGCTSYFANPEKGKEAVKSCICTTMTGALYALISIKLCSIFDSTAAFVLLTTAITFLMCIQSKIKILSYIPGAFFGSFSTFAAGGNLYIIPSILIGIFLGLACDKSGSLLFSAAGKESKENKENNENL